ncbi:MAG: hypothetical protein AAF502_13075 [Bacteroidota bacterium]
MSVTNICILWSSPGPEFQIEMTEGSNLIDPPNLNLRVIDNERELVSTELEQFDGFLVLAELDWNQSRVFYGIDLVKDLRFEYSCVQPIIVVSYFDFHMISEKRVFEFSHFENNKYFEENDVPLFVHLLKTDLLDVFPQDVTKRFYPLEITSRMILDYFNMRELRLNDEMDHPRAIYRHFVSMNLLLQKYLIHENDYSYVKQSVDYYNENIMGKLKLIRKCLDEIYRYSNMDGQAEKSFYLQFSKKYAVLNTLSENPKQDDDFLSEVSNEIIPFFKQFFEKDSSFFNLIQSR